jgi:hypothetical protein
MKKKLTLSINENILLEVKKHKINLSKFLESQLISWLKNEHRDIEYTYNHTYDLGNERIKKIDSNEHENYELTEGNIALRRRFELPLPLRRTGSQGRRVRPNFATSA